MIPIACGRFRVTRYTSPSAAGGKYTASNSRFASAARNGWSREYVDAHALLCNSRPRPRPGPYPGSRIGSSPGTITRTTGSREFWFSKVHDHHSPDADLLMHSNSQSTSSSKVSPTEVGNITKASCLSREAEVRFESLLLHQDPAIVHKRRCRKSSRNPDITVRRTCAASVRALRSAISRTGWQP